MLLPSFLFPKLKSSHDLALLIVVGTLVFPIASLPADAVELDEVGDDVGVVLNKLKGVNGVGVDDGASLDPAGLGEGVDVDGLDGG